MEPAGVANGINPTSTPVASNRDDFVNGVATRGKQVTITKLLGLQLLSRLETHRSLFQM
jgi:hypothetical protein